MDAHRKTDSVLRRFLASETSAGLILMASAALAMIVANSPLAATYHAIWAEYFLGMNVLHWINDGLIAVFFLLVGLEIKRELLHGHLSAWENRALPGFAAAGGMIVPALLYVAIASSSPDSGETLRGWAIPAATDIAFSLGVLSLLGSRVPLSLKVFLTALAILDDLGAVVIIAIFYAQDLSVPYLVGAGVLLATAMLLNRFGVKSLLPYGVIGIALWAALLHSGVHATIAGVALATTIPIDAKDESRSPLHRLEHALAPFVAFLILPVFAFANAGVTLIGTPATAFINSVSLGCALGLFLGKQVGVFGGSLLAIRLGLSRLPSGANWLQLYGTAMICGIGFTMSLFIGLLAFAGMPEYEPSIKAGVLAGSLMSGFLGWLVLRFSTTNAPRADATKKA